MLSIRLSRVGKKKAPVYRVVVMPKHRDPWANNVEILGHYNPRKTPSELVLKVDRVKYWRSQGAEATNTVWNLFVDEKIVEGEKRGATHISQKRTGKMEAKAAEAKEKETALKAKAEAEKVKAAEEKAAAEAAAAPEEAPAAEAPAEEAKEEPAPEEKTE